MKKYIITFVLIPTLLVCSTYIFNHAVLMENTLTGTFEVRDAEATPTGELVNTLTIVCCLCEQQISWPKTVSFKIYDPEDNQIYSTTYSFNDCITTINSIVSLEFELDGTYTIVFEDNDRHDDIGWDITSTIEF